MTYNSNLILSTLYILAFLTGCDLFDQSVEEAEKPKILPDNVYIEIPSSISSDDLDDRFKTMTGDSVYNYLRYFIYLNESPGNILQKTYNRLRNVNTQGISEFAFTGLDGLTKLVSLRENYVLESDTFDFYMEIYNQTYSSLALIALWNLDPLKQIIIFQPNQLNMSEMNDHPNALVRIEHFVPEPGNDYDTISSTFVYGLSPSQSNIYMPDNILLTIGKAGNILDISGSVNVPNAYFFDTTYTGGRNWTFLANTDINQNIACTQLALPPSWLETTENIFLDYAVKKVFVDELRINRPDLVHLTDDELLNAVGIDPAELEAPAYYDLNGFKSAGSDIPPGYNHLLDFDKLSPYVPVMVRDSIIEL